ncbi:acyl--CoA ligase [Gammaproteobacteria bacterium]|nr:acyl--CoA ligase [Gammaproteobacteria bacterium]
MVTTSPRDLLRKGAELHRNSLALVAPQGNLTYQELAHKTSGLATKLMSVGIGSGTQVALVMPNSEAFLVWFFAVLEAGAIIVPLDPAITAIEAKDLLSASGIRFLVVPEGCTLAHRLGMSLENGVDIKGTALLSTKLEIQPHKPLTEPFDDLVIRQFSSGSTGAPKHVLRHEENLAHDYWHFCETLGLGKGERFAGVTPFHHSYGAMGFLAAFYLGASVSLLPRFFPAPFIDMAYEYRPTIFHATPPLIEILGTCLIKPGRARALSSLKACICSTGHLRKEAYKAFRSRFGIAVFVQYGSTETLSATIDMVDEYEEGRVGRPYKGVTVGIFDDDGSPCAAGNRGRIGIRSPAVCSTYVGDPDSSARTFQGGYAFPGDRGYLDSEQRLHVLGRDDIINIGGTKVDRLEVETVIRQALPVRDVIVLEGEQGGLPVIRAVIEADPDRITRPMVIAVCRERLSLHKVPTQVEIRAMLERDEMGKIRKSSVVE